jgi:hypothetical protein
MSIDRTPVTALTARARELWECLPAASLTDTEVLTSRLPVAEILGPAALAYLDPAEFRPQPGDAVTTLASR